jgi:hypothetical protein
MTREEKLALHLEKGNGMIDRSWYASLIVGLICGGGLSVACSAVALSAAIVPIDYTEWSAFFGGFFIAMAAVTLCLLGVVAVLSWKII